MAKFILLLLFCFAFPTFAENRTSNKGSSIAYDGSSFLICNFYSRSSLSKDFGIGLDIYYIQNNIGRQNNYTTSYAITPYFTLDLLEEDTIRIESICGIGIAQSFYDNDKTPANFSPNSGLTVKSKIFSEIYMEANGLFFIYENGTTILDMAKIVFDAGNGIGIGIGIQGISIITKENGSSFNFGYMMGISYELFE